MKFLFARLSPHTRILIIGAGALIMILVMLGALRRLGRVASSPAYSQRPGS